MDTSKQATAELDRLAELIKKARIGMLTTREADSTLRSRPLATLQMDSAADLWFFTSASSPKIHEIERNPAVNLSYVNLPDEDFVSISGTASLLRDTTKMRDLWTPWIKPWFPQGLDDPDLALLRVKLDGAEYWDAPASSIKRLYGLGKAFATGKTDALGEHRKVER